MYACLGGIILGLSLKRLRLRALFVEFFFIYFFTGGKVRYQTKIRWLGGGIGLVTRGE